MKTIKWIVVAALAACGGESADPWVEEQPDVAEGVLEQEAIASFGHGFNGGAASHGVQNFACANRTTDSCIYPRDKSRKFCTDAASMTPGQLTEINADIDAILPTLATQFAANGWTFSRACGSHDVQIAYGSVPGSAITTSIMGYVSVTAQQGGLTQVFPGGAPGTHWQQTAGPLFLLVDRAAIVADFAVSDQQRVRRHALYGGMYVAGTGHGFMTSPTNNVLSIATTPAVAKSVSVSTAQKCRVNLYDPTNPALWVQTFGC